MSYNEKLAERIIDTISHKDRNVEVKKMFGGLCFMVNGKMLGGVVQDSLMIRHDPSRAEELLKQEGCRPMDFTGKPMKGFLYVDADALISEDQLEYWINVGFEYNKMAIGSKKKRDQPK